MVITTTPINKTFLSGLQQPLTRADFERNMSIIARCLDCYVTPFGNGTYYSNRTRTVIEF